MTIPAPASALTAYDLYYLQNGKRFVWSNPNHGVTLVDAGRQSAIVWRAESGEGNRPRDYHPRTPPNELMD